MSRSYDIHVCQTENLTVSAVDGYHLNRTLVSAETLIVFRNSYREQDRFLLTVEEMDALVGDYRRWRQLNNRKAA